MTQIDMDKFRASFLEEAADLLEGASDGILQAESDNDPEIFNAVFRSIHTIKGSAGSFGFDNMTEFAHHLETLLDKLRNKQVQIDADITDLLLKGIDALSEMVDYAKENKPYDRDLSSLTEMYENTNSGSGSAPKEQPQAEETAEQPVSSAPACTNTAAADILRQHNPGFGKVYQIEIDFTDEMLENGYDPMTLLSNIRQISEFCLVMTDLSKVPGLGSYEPYKLYLRPEVYVITDASLDEIQDLAFDPELMKVIEINLDAKQEPKQEPQAKTATAAPAAVQGAIDISGIDQGMISELASGIDDYFDSIENYLIEIEKTGEGSHDAVDGIFRVFHNIKGDCGYIGFTFMEQYAHLVENMLDKVRSGSVVFDRKAAEFILNIISDVKAIIRALVEKNAPMTPVTYGQLQDLKHSMLTLDEKPSPATGDTKIFLAQVDQFMEMIAIGMESPTGKPMLRRAAQGLHNAAKFIGFTDLMTLSDELDQKISSDGDFAENLEKIKEYIKELRSPAKKLGELLVETGKVTPEEVAQATAQQKKIGEILVDQGKLDKADVEVALRKQSIMKASSSGAQAYEAPQQQDDGQKDSGGKASFAQSMKVDQEKIDKFTNTIGELVVAKNAYEYMMQKLIRDYELPTTLIKDFKDNSNLISRISQDLQRDIMSLRMVPIRQVFNKFPRVVRDIARKQNKIIDLRIIGEDTEIDKKIADILSDPLVHLVRNSCDHGIETPDERTAASKPEEGHIILKAYNEGSFVYIEVIDDGHGIDCQKVLKKAVEKGLATEDAGLSDKEIMQFILAPGFSTAEKVTDISGRGVGMDVVKSSITSVGGTIDVQSSLGEGTRMVMKIPVTIGMSTSLLVRMHSDEFYAFPIENVAETIKVGKDQVKDLHFGNGIYYRGNVLPLVQLNKLLGDGENELADEVNIVITVTDAGKTGIIVDELLNRMDIAIKPVPEYFAHLNYIGGVTILGDGRAVLVINVNKLF